MRQRQYEAEVAEYQELYAALALYRRFKSGKSPDHKVSAPYADDANGGLSGPAGGRRSSPHHR
jgi:hypothetical protein